jgi:hypothetical protein
MSELKSEAEIAVHRRLNLLNGENLTSEELVMEAKGLVAELRDIFRKELEVESRALTEFRHQLCDMKPIDPEIQKIINDNFWEML